MTYRVFFPLFRPGRAIHVVDSTYTLYHVIHITIITLWIRIDIMRCKSERDSELSLNFAEFGRRTRGNVERNAFRHRIYIQRDDFKYSENRKCVQKRFVNTYMDL